MINYWEPYENTQKNERGKKGTKGEFFLVWKLAQMARAHGSA
jgi:hypothetical protein